MTRFADYRNTVASAVVIALQLVFLTNSAGADFDAVAYAQKLAPMFKEKCVACHGPVRQEVGLRLDAAHFIRNGSESGAIATPNDASSSKLIERVASSRSEHRMPPVNEGVPLNAEQVKWIQEWINAGMHAPVDEPVLAGPKEHWAYLPIVRPNIDVGESSSALDSIIDKQLEAKSIRPLASADRSTLLRRLTIDLSGLPPTPAEITSFIEDQRFDAYEQRVVQLLERPSYGERWARHWMDVWRYSDWDGYKDELRGSQRNIWHWRDWIVKSLNENKPYDQMICEMLAADEMEPLNSDSLRATGFLARNYHRSNRNIWLDATVEHTAKAFLGLTINCSKCHDHKYDPISQVDYYRFRAIFEPHHVRTDPVFSKSNAESLAFPRAYDSEPNIKTLFFVRGDEKLADKEKQISAGVPLLLPFPTEFPIVPVALPFASSYPEMTPSAESFALETAWKRIEDARSLLNSAIDKQRGAGELPNLEIEILQLRETELSLRSIVARFAAEKARLKLIDESRDKPFAEQALALEQAWKELEVELQVKIAIRGVKDSERSTEKNEAKKKNAIDKATKELKIAQDKQAKLVASDGSGKLKNYTPISNGYPTDSTGRRTALAKWIVNRSNPLTARVAINHIWARHLGTPLVENVFDFGLKTPKPELLDVLNWLSAELIDSGWDMKHIHRIIVNSSVYRRASSAADIAQHQGHQIDPDNRYCWRFNVQRLDAEAIRDSLLFSAGLLDSSMGGPDVDEEKGEEVLRRSIYFRHAYEKQMTMLVTFDAASPNECYRRRPSVVPQQALVLANGTLSRNASQQLGTRHWKEQPNDLSKSISDLFMTTLSRQPSQHELDACSSFLLEYGHSESSMQSLAHVLFNHNDFVSVR